VVTLWSPDRLPNAVSLPPPGGHSENDRVMQVNAVRMEGVPHSFAVQTLRKCGKMAKIVSGSSPYAYMCSLCVCVCVCVCVLLNCVYLCVFVCVCASAFASACVSECVCVCVCVFN